MRVRKIYLPQPLTSIKLPEGESCIAYCRGLPATVIEVTPVAGTSRVSHTLPRANILLIKSQRQLTLFNGNSPLRQYPVAIGKPATPTPTGNYSIVTKVLNPGGVLGSRWMGISAPGYGVHGTNSPWLIGQMVSLGCIRMHNAHAEELFTLINVGTPMYIRD